MHEWKKSIDDPTTSYGNSYEYHDGMDEKYATLVKTSAGMVANAVNNQLGTGEIELNITTSEFNELVDVMVTHMKVAIEKCLSTNNCYIWHQLPNDGW